MKRSCLVKTAAFVILSLFIVSDSFAGGPKSGPFIPDMPLEWTEVIAGPTNFLGRELVPTCSGFPGTDPTYAFFVKGGTVNNLVVYFQGGGACWDAQTCILGPTYYPYIWSHPADYGGMFDFENPDNPFKDWIFVFIPYCTGDIHWGSNDMDYEYAPGFFWTIHHRGFDNFLVVLKWMTENVRRPHKIFIAGSSAGSYGAIGGSPWITEMYPRSKIYVLGDAGMGISPIEFQTYSRGNWNVQLPDWIFEGDTIDLTTPEILRTIVEYYPHSKFAEFTNAWDMTQIYFYDLILDTLGMDPDEADVCLDWNAKMFDTVYFKQEALNYRSYVAAGTQHVILPLPEFYTEDSAGVSFLDWVDTMVRNQGGTHGHGGVPWENAECFDCSSPGFCPY